MLTSTHTLPDLPPSVDLETVPVLKALAEANRALAELKGRAAAIPNQGILIDTLALQEAKASSEIENIATTQDELFRADLLSVSPRSGAAKEVARCCWKSRSSISAATSFEPRTTTTACCRWCASLSVRRTETPNRPEQLLHKHESRAVIGRRI